MSIKTSKILQILLLFVSSTSNNFSSHLSSFRLTKVDDGDSVASSSEQSTGEITALIGPQGPSAAEIRVNANEMLARVNARIVQNSTHAHNVQNRVESPLPLTNMDLETQRYQVQVQSFKEARASRLATPVKRRPTIPKTPASARRVSHEVSSYQTPSQLQRPSRIQTPGTGRSLQERMERSNQKRHEM